MVVGREGCLLVDIVGKLTAPDVVEVKTDDVVVVSGDFVVVVVVV